MDKPSQQQGSEQRTAVRFDTHLPVRLDGERAVSHNISTNGIYFETDVPHELGALVNLTVEFQLYGQRHRLLCEGKVVRVEAQGTRIGVAARLLAPLFTLQEPVQSGT
ncbi:PilZ domain-containing protein [Ramlibacter sp. G-1-2-2]|uniref:PilZ domain-containing protein n=1 Tax=Ramlibacter agri TaxID=2728837 RepID=A0A848H6R4_9BURK|nr:PilZ domain-containing protein [Ramlibacter agri]NML45562.1 PilZ domain-containing protein [Ramlibacter agri]